MTYNYDKEREMKKNFLNYSVNIIASNYDFDDIRLEEISYGLETLYLTVTKLVVIFGLAYLLGILKEVVLLLLCYNLIRSTAYGLHASKSIYCLISSITLFIGGVYLSKYIATIPLVIKIVLCTISIILLLKYAPADTVKRPLINAKKRRILKIKSCIKGIVYLILIIYFKDSVVSGYLLCGLVEAILMIHPFVYKIFSLPYDNYKEYNCGV